MYKSKWRIYLNNSIAFLLFKLLGIFFKKSESKGESRLFINTGNLGDALITSMIFENERKLENPKLIYVIIKEEFKELFSEYSGSINIIFWNYRRYKYNIFYRIKFLNRLKKIKFKETYNLTFARGITSDELALLSGAEKIFCMNSNSLYLTKLFAKIMDGYYDKVLFQELKNEYDRHLKLFGNLYKIELTVSQKNSVLSRVCDLPEAGFIVIAPFASQTYKEYPVSSFIKIAEELSNKYMVFIIGSASEKTRLKDCNFQSKNIFNKVGKYKLNELCYMISRASLFIGNDSGLTHLAVKTGAKTVAIIGGSGWGSYFPYGEGEKRKFLYHQMDCFGCEGRCIHSEPFCITNVLPSQVISFANNMLTN